jgi:predicted ATPase/DNA-binding CsgD family transcriptional regulator/Tfp pilus assembly protein PilF
VATGGQRRRHTAVRKAGPASHGALNLLARATRTRLTIQPAHLRPARQGIPAQPTPLIGRDHEIRLVRDQLMRPDVRLLTLTGPAGTGKTRLALEAAGELFEAIRDGAFLVNLAPISDPSLVIPEIARALGIHEEVDGSSPLETLKAALQDKYLLLVLDNFEQVVAAAPHIADLLAACPTLKVLTTSRATLRLRWEHEVAVPPLGIPNLHGLPSLDELSLVASVALFLERAQAVTPEFRLTEDNAAAIAEICVRLDGLPLALELAAARVKLFSPAAILARLEHRFDLLRADTQDRPDRHHTLRAALDWSYLLLPAHEQRLLRSMAIFVGGCTLDAVERIVGTPPLEGLASLLDKSLVRHDRQTQDTRLTMLETVRQYALEQLATSGELGDTQFRHAEYCVELAEAAERELVGPNQAHWFERLEHEHDNLRAALRWCIDNRALDMGARLGGALWQFWSTRGYPREGRVWLSELRSLVGSQSRTAAQAKLLAGGGRLAYEQGDYAAARALHQESLDIGRELNDLPAVARSLGQLGDVAHQLGDYVTAQQLFEESLAILRQLNDHHGVAQALNKLGLTVRCLGDYGAARSLYEEALGIGRELGDRGWEALVLNNLGRVAYYQGHFAAAYALHEQSLAIRRQVGDRRGTATSLGDLGDVAHQQANYTVALRLREESLSLWQQLDDPWGLAYALEGFAELAAVREQHGLVIRLVAASTVQREAIRAPRSPASAERMQRLVESARRRLGRVQAADAWAEGQRLSAAEAVLATTSLRQPHVAPAAAAEPPGHLSRREREVATLITRGLTNRQIADALVIGERTVHTHVANVLDKLELTSRTQIATWGVAQGLGTGG